MGDLDELRRAFLRDPTDTHAALGLLEALRRRGLPILEVAVRAYRAGLRVSPGGLARSWFEGAWRAVPGRSGDGAGSLLLGPFAEPSARRLSHLRGAGLDLRCASLDGAVLIAAELTGADLSWASLRDAELGERYLAMGQRSFARLRAARLRGADLTGCDLEGADLRGAALVDAHLEGAQLGGALLEGASLEGARAAGANLRRANARGADLRCEGLAGADLRRLAYDEETRWPPGFEPARAGAHLALPRAPMDGRVG